MDIFGDMILDALILGGLTSVAVLWVFSAAAAFHALWDTFGKHSEALIKKIKG